MDLKGKRILLIGPGYNNYIYKLSSTYEKLGAYIELYLENPAAVFCSNFYLSRLQKFQFFKKICDKQIIITNNIILTSLETKIFDHVIIIKGDLLTDEFLIKLRMLMPKAFFVFYQWDSIVNFNYLEKIEYFDKVFSFDYLDCSRYKEKIFYLPLFYSEEYARIARINNIEYEFDIYFLGWNHSIRVRKLNEIMNFCEMNKLKYSFYMRTTISEKIKLVLSGSKIHCFFNPLKFEQFSDEYIKSKAILDISSPDQTGLPIRIIEAFGANKKIITTNTNIINEDFYDSKMIFIWDKDKTENIISFLNQKHEKKGNDNYSIESFALKLISL